MTGPLVRVDTGMMQTTAQQSSVKADNMLTQAKTLAAGIQYARDNWRGAAGDAFRLATQNLDRTLQQLVTKLQLVSGTVKRGGEGFASQDAGAGAKVTAQGQGIPDQINF